MSRILLIDDNELFRVTVVRMLTGAGYEVVQASNGQEALDIYRREGRFDLLLVDLIMPEKDGLEVIQELRREEPRPPMIAVSGGGRIEATRYLELARRFGAVRVLSKPFSRDDLLSAVQQVFSKPESG